MAAAAATLRKEKHPSLYHLADCGDGKLLNGAGDRYRQSGPLVLGGRLDKLPFQMIGLALTISQFLHLIGR